MESWPRRHRITVDEYYRMAEVGLLAPDARVELIEGEIIDMPPIGSDHGSVVDRLTHLFHRSPAAGRYANTVWTTPSDLSVVLGWRYVGEVKPFNDDPSTPLNENPVDAEQYIDLGATYYADWFGSDNTTEINFGISNVLDNDPPVSGYLGGVPFANGNTVPGTWDTLGRYYFVGFVQSF